MRRLGARDQQMDAVRVRQHHLARVLDGEDAAFLGQMGDHGVEEGGLAGRGGARDQDRLAMGERRQQILERRVVIALLAMADRIGRQGAQFPQAIAVERDAPGRVVDTHRDRHPAHVAHAMAHRAADDGGEAVPLGQSGVENGFARRMEDLAADIGQLAAQSEQIALAETRIRLRAPGPAIGFDPYLPRSVESDLLDAGLAVIRG